MKRRLVFAALVALAATPSQAGCRIGMANIAFGWDSSLTGTVTKGGACVLKFSENYGSGFGSVTISTPARHGHATASGASVYPEVTYKPAPGYRGTDEFVFIVDGGGKRNQGPSHVHVTLDVE